MIDIVNESPDLVDEISLAEQARFVLERLRIHPQAELSVALVDADAMADLHVRWMDEPGPTDVMSFPMDELRVPRDDEEAAEGLLGDIVICPEVARRQAAQAGHSERHELGILLTHGILHLLGYDHVEPDDERLMFGLQNRLVGEWNALARVMDEQALARAAAAAETDEDLDEDLDDEFAGDLDDDTADDDTAEDRAEGSAEQVPDSKADQGEV